MARKYSYNGTVYNSLKEIAQVIGISRVRPKNFTKYGITEVDDSNHPEQIASVTVGEESNDVSSTTYNSDGDVWFHDPTTRAELIGQNGESFNKRAFVTTVKEGLKTVKYLTSYGGVVAKVVEDAEYSAYGYITNKGKTALVYGTYSANTLSHIRAFLQKEGFVAESCQQIRTDYMK